MDFIDFRRIPYTHIFHVCRNVTDLLHDRTKALRGGKSFELDVELKKPSQSVITMITSVRRIPFSMNLFTGYPGKRGWSHRRASV